MFFKTKRNYFLIFDTFLDIYFTFLRQKKEIFILLFDTIFILLFLRQKKEIFILLF